MAGHNLPSAYQEVEYLQSIGTKFQYIDTGIVSSTTTMDYIELSVIDFSTSNLGAYFGCCSGAYNGTGLRLFSSGVSTNNIAKIKGKYCYKMNGTDYGIDGEDVVFKLTLIDGVTRFYSNDSLVSGTNKWLNDDNISIFLFAMKNSNGNPGYNISAKVSYFLIKNGGTKILEYIPCYRISDSKPGMYDLVSNTFFVNQGTGTDFIVGPDVVTAQVISYSGERLYVDGTRLPSAYQEVEYLQNTGSYSLTMQYIDTGIVPNASTFKMDMKISDYTASYLFGLRQDSNMGLGITYSSSKWNIYHFGYHNNALFDSTSSDFLNNKTTIIHWEEGNISFDVDGTVYSCSPTGTLSTTMTMYLFHANNGTAPALVKIHYCKIYEGNTLVRDFVPCYRKSDNVAGMYDLVTNTLFVNQGRGADFIVGPDVSLKKIIPIKQTIFVTQTNGVTEAISTIGGRYYVL